MSTEANYELDRKTSIFWMQLWLPSSFQSDPQHKSCSISSQGQILGHSQIIEPETDIERWSTFDLNNFRKSSVTQEQLTHLLQIGILGQVSGQVGFVFEPENSKESESFRRQHGHLGEPIRLREDWV